jgi:imidazolonepropionase-like amidohydrolase
MTYQDHKFIYAGWLIDGTGGPIQKNMLMHVSDGRIINIKKAGQNDLDDYDTLDFSGFTILPCLVDCHVHLFMSGTEDPEIRKTQLTAGFDYIKEVISEHIKAHLSYGVLTLRDAGDSSAHALRYKEELLDLKKSPICLKVAGKAWHSKGRYGKLIARPPSDADTLSYAISNESDRVDHIKIVNSGLNSLTVFGKQTKPQFGQKELKNAVYQANTLGLKVMVHANGKIPVKIAIEAGCDSIEHGFFMGNENLQRMADKNISWVPTAYTMKAYAQCLKQSSIEAQIAKKNLDHQLNQISKAKKLGVPIALGTDAGSLGVSHGPAIFEEMRLLMQAGYSIEEAVKCASQNGADLLGLKGQGVLVKDMPGTFIAAKGDPSNFLQNIKNCKVHYS